MINFEYARATDVADAVRQIAADPAAKFIAGGTNLLGFKWSSQHLERGGCDGHSEAAFGSVRARRLALAWSALCCAA